MDVETVLERINQRQEEISSITQSDKQLTIDLGTLSAWDPSVIALPKTGSKREDYLRDLARENAQLLLNSMNDASEIVEGERLLSMPEPTTTLPRSKSVPKPKEPTRWEEFAKRKGIKSNKNRDKLVWDDATRQWVPRYGYKKVQNDNQKNWCEVLPDEHHMNNSRRRR